MSKFKVNRVDEDVGRIELHPDSEYEYGEVVKLNADSFGWSKDDKTEKHTMGKVIAALRAPMTDTEPDEIRRVQNIFKLPKRFLYKIKFKNGEIRTIKQEYLEKTTKEERFLYEMGLPAEVEECEEEKEIEEN